MSTAQSDYLDAVLERVDAVILDDARLVEPEADPQPDLPLDPDPFALVREHVRSGGKRFRPILALWGWVYGGGDASTPTEDLVTLGAALELLHTFALVHDDVMDEAAVRRGGPTIHVTMADQHRGANGVGRPERFGESMATLVGDLAAAQAYRLGATLPAPVLADWHAMVVELVVGQAREVVGTATARRSLAHTRQVAMLKSGRYSIQRPLELGARLAGADEARMSELTAYGQHLGEAFAMRDDVLGVWGSQSHTGKPVGHDLRDGKATVLLALVQDLLPPAAQEILSHAVAGPLDTSEVTLLTHALETVGARDRAEAHIEEQLTLALAALDGTAPAAAVEALTEMAHRVTRRQS